MKKKYKASEIANTFGIKVRDVYNIHAKKAKEKNSSKENQTIKRFLISHEMYNELEIFLSAPKNRASTLNRMRNHLVGKFNLDNRRISLSTISNMIKKLSFSRKRTKKKCNKKECHFNKRKKNRCC